MQPTGNHQMQHQPEIILHSNRDALANPPQSLHNSSFNLGERRLDGSQ
jgi:hypothetical protein